MEGFCQAIGHHGNGKALGIQLQHGFLRAGNAVRVEHDPVGDLPDFAALVNNGVPDVRKNYQFAIHLSNPFHYQNMAETAVSY